ncbi:hypothetical protein HAX54_005149 [Datura stramonium]|uniref:Uncharacterized protein n=1 Tax=Datura stramonium TaxID=4076 RepID=A0ABS8T871_DATST|nr:hypothetical protein [Datura stramonium]
MAPPPLRRYGLHWVTEKEDRILTLGLGFMFNVPGDCNLNMGVDVTKTKEPKGINGPVLTVNERNARIDEMLSHLVGLGYKEPLDDDVAMEDEMARVDSDIESSDDDEEDFEMGEAVLAPTNDEE